MKIDLYSKLVTISPGRTLTNSKLALLYVFAKTKVCKFKCPEKSVLYSNDNSVISCKPYKYSNCNFPNLETSSIPISKLRVSFVSKTTLFSNCKYLVSKKLIIYSKFNGYTCPGIFSYSKFKATFEIAPGLHSQFRVFVANTTSVIKFKESIFSVNGKKSYSLFNIVETSKFSTVYSKSIE